MCNPRPEPKTCIEDQFKTIQCLTESYPGPFHAVTDVSVGTKWTYPNEPAVALTFGATDAGYQTRAVELLTDNGFRVVAFDPRNRKLIVKKDE